MSSGSKKEPSYTCLSEAKASHLHRMWAEVSSSAPNLLYDGLSEKPHWVSNIGNSLLRVECSSGYANAPQCYVVCKLPVVFSLWYVL